MAPTFKVELGPLKSKAAWHWGAAVVGPTLGSSSFSVLWLPGGCRLNSILDAVQVPLGSQKGIVQPEEAIPSAPDRGGLQLQADFMHQPPQLLLSVMHTLHPQKKSGGAKCRNRLPAMSIGDLFMGRITPYTALS